MLKTKIYDDISTVYWRKIYFKVVKKDIERSYFQDSHTISIQYIIDSFPLCDQKPDFPTIDLQLMGFFKFHSQRGRAV